VEIMRKRSKLKRTNSLSLSDYRKRIINQHKAGRLYLAFEIWVLYKNAGGVTPIIKMTNATGIDKEYYQKKMRSIIRKK